MRHASCVMRGWRKLGYKHDSDLSVFSLFSKGILEGFHKGQGGTETVSERQSTNHHQLIRKNSVNFIREIDDNFIMPERRVNNLNSSDDSSHIQGLNDRAQAQDNLDSETNTIDPTIAESQLTQSYILEGSTGDHSSYHTLLSQHSLHNPREHDFTSTSQGSRGHWKADDQDIHPFIKILISRGIIRSRGDALQTSAELETIIERARLWDSMHNKIRLCNTSYSSIFLYPAAKLKQNPSTPADHDISIATSGFCTINKALSTRIVDCFLDGEKLAYTIWVYDAERSEEWYAPVRYTSDFFELREVTSRLSKYVEKLDFPSSSWLATLASSAEVSESQSSRDVRCFRLETFLRDLFKAIYLHPLTPNSAEIALYLQTFLGVDSCMERLVYFSPTFFCSNNTTQNIEKEMARSHLLVSIQNLTFRIFLLTTMSQLVNSFVSDMRSIFLSSTSSSLYEQEMTKSSASKSLTRIKSFLHQVQSLIFDGCIHEFRSIASNPQYSLIFDESNSSYQADQEALFLEAVRIQVEVECFIPLRASISKYLTNLWRDDDYEIQRKIKVLRTRPQSYFNIPASFQSPSNWKIVSDIITIGLGRQSLPCIKLQSLANAGKAIPQLFASEHNVDESEPLSADIVLPIYIYATVNADVDRPYALSVLLRNVCDPSTEIGIIGYYLATFEAAIAHIMVIDV